MNEPLNVLVIEDSSADFLLIERHLKQAGLVARYRRVTSLAELHDALEASMWDVVLSDYSIPQMNFLESLTLVLDRLPEVPLILVSGSIGEEKAVELLKKGVWDFVLKDHLPRLAPAITRSLREAADHRARKAAETALRESEAGYRSLFENMLEGYARCRMVYDGERPVDFIYLGVNRAFETLTGLQNVIEKKATTVIPGIRESNPELFEIYGRVAATGVPERFETYVDSLGIWFAVAVSSTERGYFVAVFDNISERKRQEEEREKLKAELHQAQKMEAIGRLAGGVAHDFNNMLNVILGFTEISLARLEPAAPLYKHLQQIQKAGQRSADLIRQLLAFSRKQVTTPTVIPLNEVIRDQQMMLGRLVGEDITFSMRLADDLWNIRTDPSQIDQILINLTVNARDAIAAAGAIGIETANVTLDDDAARSQIGLPPGDYVLLSFSDTGCGMDAATRERIFEPFFTTKDVGKGTGLGLSTVYGIVRQHDGAIHVYSEPGIGTTFRIYFPRFHGETPAPLPEVRGEPPTGHETVLLVEDDVQILELARTMLAECGYTVLAAATPGEACRLCERHVGRIELLVSDMVMPTMNGRALQARIEGIKPGIRVLFMSGYTADMLVPRGGIDQGMDFIAKPFSMQAFVEKVRAVLNREGPDSREEETGA